MNRSYFLLIITLLSVQTSAYKILMYSPTIGHSHVTFAGKIVDTLLDAGHEVVVYMPLMDPDVTANGTSRARVIRYQALKDPNSWYDLSWKKDPFDENMDLMTDENMETFWRILNDICESQITNEQLLNQLREEKFDIAMTELFDYCPFGFFKLLNIPTQIITSATPYGDDHTILFGIPSPLSYVPNMYTGMTEEMSYTERAINLYIRYLMLKWSDGVALQQNLLFRRYFGEEFPCLLSLSQKSAALLANSVEMFEFARPITHKVIFIGGIGVPEPNPLDQTFEKVVSSSEKGAVFVSFGSLANCSSFPMEKKVAILQTFANFPEYQFIWKYEQPEKDRELFAKYPNVHLVKWAPQVDLLNHPKLKAFVTHGGLNSITEAIHFGIPMVAIPLFADQEHNVAVAVKRGVAVLVDRKELTTEKLTDALQQVLSDQSFTIQARRLAAMIAKKPLKPKELVVKWTEFVAEFQDLSNLDLAGRDFGLIKYYCIDIFAPFVALSLVALVVFFWLFRCILNRTCRFMTVKEKMS